MNSKRERTVADAARDRREQKAKLESKRIDPRHTVAALRRWLDTTCRADEEIAIITSPHHESGVREAHLMSKKSGALFKLPLLDTE